MTLGTRLEKRMGRLALAAAVVTVALLVVPTIASPESQVVIRGAEHSSHLRLTVSGNDLLVHGYMYPGQQIGCRYAEDAAHVVCPLDGVGSVEVDMGPGNDKVDVLDPLPIPLTVYLGDGSDGFHGNNESDTCYSQGAKKNRCVTGAGDDVCITGQRNSDCFMGAGNDICMHGAGSDACWGDAGNDVCYMGPGMDGCHGGPGDDRLYGGGNSDRLFGGPGNDFCEGGPPGSHSSDACWGGPGNDVCYMGPGMDGCHGGPGDDRLYGGPQPDRLFGGAGRDYCNGEMGRGRSIGCETGPGH